MIFRMLNAPIPHSPRSMDWEPKKGAPPRGLFSRRTAAPRNIGTTTDYAGLHRTSASALRKSVAANDRVLPNVSVARDSSTPDLALLSWQSVENLFQFLGQLENTVMVVLGLKAGPLILEAGGLPRAKYRRQNRFYGARLPETETPPKHTEKTDLGRARKPPLSPSGWCEIDPRRVPLSCRSFSSRNRFQIDTNGSAGNSEQKSGGDKRRFLKDDFCPLAK
jgi:hypothetical protein